MVCRTGCESGFVGRRFSSLIVKCTVPAGVVSKRILLYFNNDSWKMRKLIGEGYDCIIQCPNIQLLGPGKSVSFLLEMIIHSKNFYFYYQLSVFSLSQASIWSKVRVNCSCGGLEPKRNTAMPRNQAALIQRNVEGTICLHDGILFFESRFQFQICEWLISRKNPSNAALPGFQSAK